MCGGGGGGGGEERGAGGGRKEKKGEVSSGFGTKKEVGGDPWAASLVELRRPTLTKNTKNIKGDKT